MRFIRGWRWWERAFGALCGAIAALMWMAILIPEKDINTGQLPTEGTAGGLLRRRASVARDAGRGPRAHATAPSRLTRQRRG